MNKLIQYIVCFLKSPGLMFSFIFGISLFSLMMGFIAEGFFGLEPCRLCIYQRYPFAIGMVLGIAGLIKRKELGLSVILLYVGALNFLSNAGIAFYHTGVEREWWESTEACKLPDFGDNGKTLFENIMSTPGGRCDEIPWADPFIGLSMANYNVLLCLGLCAACLLSAHFIGQKMQTQASALDA